MENEEHACTCSKCGMLFGLTLPMMERRVANFHFCERCFADAVYRPPQPAPWPFAQASGSPVEEVDLDRLHWITQARSHFEQESRRRARMREELRARGIEPSFTGQNAPSLTRKRGDTVRQALTDLVHVAQAAASQGATVSYAPHTAARDVVLRAVGLSDASQKVQDVALHCVVGAVCAQDGTGLSSSSFEQRDALGRAFTIGAYPVVQALWEAVMKSNPSQFVDETRPVEQVTWFDCVTFCAALNSKLDLPPTSRVDPLGAYVCSSNEDGFRLPTVLEWERAAPAGQPPAEAGGSDFGGLGWHNGNSGRQTQPVGRQRPNALGLYDMLGNVWEWCWDSSPDERDTLGRHAAVERQTLCGGSWSDDPDALRVGRRLVRSPTLRRPYFGFRLARTIP